MLRISSGYVKVTSNVKGLKKSVCYVTSDVWPVFLLFIFDVKYDITSDVTLILDGN